MKSWLYHKILKVCAGIHSKGTSQSLQTAFLIAADASSPVGSARLSARGVCIADFFCSRLYSKLITFFMSIFINILMLITFEITSVYGLEKYTQMRNMLPQNLEAHLAPVPLFGCRMARCNNLSLLLMIFWTCPPPLDPISFTEVNFAGFISNLWHANVLTMYNSCYSGLCSVVRLCPTLCKPMTIGRACQVPLAGLTRIS